MRFVERNLWPCLALVLVACSLVTEFPEPQEEVTSRDAGRDGGGSSVSCDGNNDCQSDELCCNSRCVATSKSQCTACGNAGACGDEAPNCNNRTCECEEDSGRACTDSQVCDPKTSECVGCRTSADCTAKGGKLTQCVDARCVECDRKEPANPTDDQGCVDTRFPICSAAGVCESCKTNEECGPGLTCNPSLGCFGCSINEMDLSKNGCKVGAPICRALPNNVFQCERCASNNDCKGGFCNEGDGTCHAACDPAPMMVQASNGCTSSRPSCKPDATGAFSCQTCATNADCVASPGTTCVTTGPQAGTCVRGPTGPADCVAPTPAFLPPDKCVECTTDAQCATSTVGKYCNPADNKCAPCTAIGNADTRDTACSGRTGGAAPFCHRSGLCVACRTSANCAMTPATPICSEAGICVGCNTLSSVGVTPDDACDMLVDDYECVTGGTAAPIGSCAACDPADASGCSSSRLGVPPMCAPRMPGGPPVCHGCNPDVPGTCGSLTCRANSTGVHECVPGGGISISLPGVNIGVGR